MRSKAWLHIILLSLFLFLNYGATSGDSITVLTYNIRLDSPADGIDNWHNRKSDLVEFIHSQNPDFLGIQEGLFHQVLYLDSMLTNYTYIGVGRDDGIESGEFMAIFYKSAWSLAKEQTIWLSPTPTTPTKGWDAACYRTATMGTFRHDIKGQISIVNTHFDHEGHIARSKSTEVLSHHLKSLDKPYILMGDFNLTPADPVYNDLIKLGVDTGKELSLPTFNAFDIHSNGERRIDYIFCNGLPDRFKNSTPLPLTKAGRHLSDHFPVKTIFYL